MLIWFLYHIVIYYIFPMRMSFWADELLLSHLCFLNTLGWRFFLAVYLFPLFSHTLIILSIHLFGMNTSMVFHSCFTSLTAIFYPMIEFYFVFYIFLAFFLICLIFPITYHGGGDCTALSVVFSRFSSLVYERGKFPMRNGAKFW